MSELVVQILMGIASRRFYSGVSSVIPLGFPFPEARKMGKRAAARHGIKNLTLCTPDN
jgi:hypothetical protein